ncbi:hypothetical protein MCI89_24770 [Muricomes sp. OA1]|uniref:hypothetical protein n=1 Tax=Muricomes sp. OA1 TaxID=2914165 RepID=UPI001F06A483|nr:hypothetical protein [Muricomes sp. OA1]MCH1975553.1 hypothetical protein [Muricomes sp. OA1]
MEISRNTQGIKPSSIRKMFNKALQYDDVISFTLGEPDFTASENVVEAGCRAIRQGYTNIPRMQGCFRLEKRLVKP